MISIRLNVKLIDKYENTKYFSYEFEDDVLFSSGKFDKTERLIYENDICEYVNNEYYQVKKGEFKYKGDDFVGWYLIPLNENLKIIPFSQNIASKILIKDDL